ncbi:hypothetical protein IC235_14665 [Hymenobacter sp. BT664]|uniref:Uncharacterized protein n=1 Tax=Hymenobacter montanus TaxID=2771359 RepID=A0A927GKG1_9BACT|nr:hypothetical protein [Hymenobacter montanus]MBD2769134.1 hypothetical protein [Hymenobacter montanus]
MFQEIELANLFNWAVLPTDLAATPLQDPEAARALKWLHALPSAEQNDALARIGARLPDLDAAKSAALLVLTGRLVEDGASPDAVVPGGLAHLDRLRHLHEPIAADTWCFSVIGLMAMLCRSASARALLKQQAELLTWLEEYEDLSDHFGYLLHMARAADEDVLWVLFPTNETGLEVSVAQVHNTFQLLTLLQPLVLEQAAGLKLTSHPVPIDPGLLRYARGDASTSPVEEDHARFEWLTTAAYLGGPLDSWQLAWGEAAVFSLPRVRGKVTLIATEKEARMARSWDVNFLALMHDANRPDVRFRRLLPAAEVRALLAEIHPPVSSERS